MSVYRGTCSHVSISSPEHANGFRRSHNEWSAEIGFHQGDERELVVVTRPIPLVIFVFSLFLGPSAKDGRLVCLWNEEKKPKCNSTSDHNDPIRPSPALEFCNETTDHRSEHRPIHGTYRPNRKADSTRTVVRYVCDCTRRVGDHGTASDSSEESHHYYFLESISSCLQET